MIWGNETSGKIVGISDKNKTKISRDPSED